MPHRNLRKIFFSEKILLMHQFWFLSFPLYELKTIPARMGLCFCLPGLLLSLWIFLSHQTFYSSMLSVYNSELLTVRQEGPQSPSGAKPSFHLRGNLSAEKWSDKKVLVLKLGTVNQALPPILCWCQRITNQVPPGPTPTPGAQIASGTLGQEEAEGRPPRTAAVYLFHILGLKTRFHLKERVSL